MSVVWATSAASRSHWARHRPTAAAGRLHTITSRANLVLWHMHVPLPWHMHLCLRMIDRCRVTRPGPANSNSTLLSFASGPEIGKGCALCNPTMLYCCYLILTLLATLSPTHHRLWIARTRNTLFHIKHQHSHSDGNRSLFPDRSHACISARYTRLYNCFWASNSNSLSQSSQHYNTSH